MRERLGTAAIVVFIIVDVVLVTLAFRHSNPAVPPEPQRGSPSATGTPSTTGESPSTDPAPAGAGSNQPLFLAAAENGALLRATRGSCQRDLQPVVEASTDDGRSFDRVRVAADLSEVLRVQADSADALSLVGADGSCEVGTYTGAVDDRTWDLDSGTAGQWHLLPDPDQAGVHAMSVVVETPCAPVGLSVVRGGGPRVLCDTGSIIGTADQGQSWVALGRLDGAAAISYASPGDGYALAAQRRCPAAVLQTSDGGTTWERLTCLPGDQPRALAAEGSFLAAQVGDAVHVSHDGGQSWTSHPPN